MEVNLTPTKRLLLWVIEQGGRVHWSEYQRAGMELGEPATRPKLIVRDTRSFDAA
jgi:hypothetical protein